MLRGLIIAITCLAGPLYAACDGPSLFDTLTPSEALQIDSDAAALPYANGTQWIATKNAKVIRLIGTMHINDPRLDPIIDDLAPDIAASDLVLLEATPDQEAQVQAYMAANPDLLFIVDGPTLPEMLDEATWQRIADAARARQIPPFLIAKFRPWYVMMTLALPPCAMPDLMAGRRGLDQRITDTAVDIGVPIDNLEPFDTVLKVFQTGSIEENAQMLALSVPDAHEASAMFVAMLDAYFAQDIGRLMALSRVIAMRAPDVDPAQAAAMLLESETMLLGDRNVAWLPVIQQALSVHDSIMIAVGAAHLPGDSGLLRLLEIDGWTVTPR